MNYHNSKFMLQTLMLLTRAIYKLCHKRKNKTETMKLWPKLHNLELANLWGRTESDMTKVT